MGPGDPEQPAAAPTSVLDPGQGCVVKPQLPARVGQNGLAVVATATVSVQAAEFGCSHLALQERKQAQGAVRAQVTQAAASFLSSCPRDQSPCH